MNGIIIDTTLLVAAERGKFDLPAFFQANIDTPFAVSAVTVAELWHGVERIELSGKPAKAATAMALLSDVEIFDYTEETALIHARVWAELKASGKPIGAHDMIIAATCLEHGYAIATMNIKHFSKVRGLALISDVS